MFLYENVATYIFLFFQIKTEINAIFVFISFAGADAMA